MMSLLPKNATSVERALEAATAPDRHLAGSDAALRTFKDAPPDALLPSLVWEYAVGELVPWLGGDACRAIADGVAWNRLRGTPAALKTLLGWVWPTPIAIEEEEAGSAHFAEFMVDPGRVLSDAEVATLVAAARLSAPARSRLARVFHAYDIRRLRLDHSRLGDAMLSDYSGTPWPGDGHTRLSFGRWQQIELNCGLQTLSANREALHAQRVRYADRCLLDEMLTSVCKPLPNPKIEHGQSIEAVQINALEGRGEMRPERKFCRAQIVLSDGPALEDTNACLPVAHFVPGEATHFVLSVSRLSDHDGRGRWEAVLERLERRQQVVSFVSGPTSTHARARVHERRAAPWRQFRTSHLRLSHDRPDSALGSLTQRSVLHGSLAAYSGQRWVGGWSNQSWSERREIIESEYYAE